MANDVTMCQSDRLVEIEFRKRISSMIKGYAMSVCQGLYPSQKKSLITSLEVEQ